jgi:hypothetical protein
LFSKLAIVFFVSDGMGRKELSPLFEVGGLRAVSGVISVSLSGMVETGLLNQFYPTSSNCLLGFPILVFLKLRHDGKLGTSQFLDRGKRVEKCGW